MIKKYDHQAIEKKWQKRWKDEKIFAVSNDAPDPRSYVLDMFPYPSADGLHVGHPEGYTGTDIVARFRRMNGQRVLHPMGWDAFGLPAENFAIKKGVHPRVVTEKNIANFKRQIQSLGFSYDWEREINTTDPKYYKWTQWIFLQLFKQGLAYEKEAPIWWCPKDKTGLANEEVINGKCDRCGTVVERKMLKQWMLKITAYADRLLQGLEKLDWPEGIKALQRNWIGKSEGTEVDFMIGDQKVTVFTTRPDTLFGATYLVLSPEHELVSKITTAKQKKAVEKYVKQVAAKSDLERTALEKEKTGVFIGAYAINPVNNEKIPVWIADYVLMSYGTGAIMAVPGHDERDFAFAKKYDLPIRTVIEPVTGEPRPNEELRKSIVAIVQHPKTKKVLSINWSEKNGGNLFIGGGREPDEDPVACAIREIKEETGYTGVKLLEQSEIIHHHYFAHSKNVARNIEAIGLYFELSSEKQNQPQVEKDEQGKFTIEWLTPDEAENKVRDPLHSYLFQKFIRGKCFTGEGLMTNGPQIPASPIPRNPVESPAVSPGAYGHLGTQLELVGYSGAYVGISSQDFRKKIVTWLEKKDYGKRATQYKLRDWVFSRQRYWGEPIPLIHCPKDGVVPVPEDQLPVVLPEVEKYQPTGTGESPLAGIDEWVNMTCPKCGGPAKRETNTMPQWAGSCWYYLRFTDPHNDKEFASQEALKTWMPVDLYVGGAEHAVLHLLYSRFWHLVLYDIGAIPKKNARGVSLEEPFLKLKNQGLILGPDGEKMSKSRGNVINPDDIVEKYGADTLRMYEMFMGPFEDAKPWDTNGIVGVRRFLDKVVETAARVGGTVEVGDVGAMRHAFTKSITTGIIEFRFNTCVSDFMKWINHWKKYPRVPQQDFEVFLKLLSPFAPHLAEELWSQLGHKTLLVQETWPKFDASKIQSETVTIAIQVNGKHRGNVTMPTGSNESVVREKAEAEPNVKKYLTTKPKKVVYVKDRLMNFVL